MFEVNTAFEGRNISSRFLDILLDLVLYSCLLVHRIKINPQPINYSSIPRTTGDTSQL